MRPDVARAFDRMESAARADGVALTVVSGFRTNAEQAILFARHPDPKWVAPPGRSMHRLGTELDLGPEAAYGWLAANAERFHFVQRYSWELRTVSVGTVGMLATTRVFGYSGGAVGELSKFSSVHSSRPAKIAWSRTRPSSSVLIRTE